MSYAIAFGINSTEIEPSLMLKPIICIVTKLISLNMVIVAHH